MLLIAILAMMWAGSAQAQSRQAYAVLDGYGKLTFYYDENKASRPGTKWDVGDGSEASSAWGRPKDMIKAVVFDSSFKDYAGITTTNSWFKECISLSDITGFSNLNTQNVKDMNQMFYNCSDLQSVDLSSFNTASVTDMSSMFQRCSDLQNVDLSGWNTEKVTDMNQMFQECSALQSVNLSNFNTANVTDMDEMFWDCSSLQSLDLSGFNTASVTDMDGMFKECSSLQSLDLSNFNTANVKYMVSMFQGCRALTELDLTNWDTANASGKSMMFSDCSALTTIVCDDTWTTIVCDDTWTGGKSLDMFLGCTSLVGGPNGTVTYDATRTDIAMANPTDGYFTLSTAVGITAAEANGIERDEATYNLSGQRVGRDFRGITVRRGRKVLKK